MTRENMAHNPHTRIRTALTALLLAAPAFACGAADQPRTEDDIQESARGIHERVITMDTHVDINPSNFQAGQSNYVSGIENTQVDLPKMEEGGLDAVWFSIYQGQQQDFTPDGYARAYATATAKIEAVRRLTAELAPDRIALALTADDVRRIAGEGKKVALMGMENGYAIGEDVGNVRRFAELGVRYLSLAHNGNNQLSDSNNGQPDGERHGGLSELGRQVVAEANRWGIVLDISHPSKRANMQTMELSRAPVMASHSSVRALGDHTRNLDDEELQAVKANGGVVQVTAFASYINVPPRERTEALAALRTEFELTGPMNAALAALPADRRASYDTRVAGIDAQWPAPPRATVADFVDHIVYAVNLIGVEHVGISSDFDGGGGVDGWNSATETFNVTLELVRRGYTEDQIAAMWSGNLLRVMEQVERVAAELQGASN